MNLGPTNNNFCLDCGCGWAAHQGPICPDIVDDAERAWARDSMPGWLKALTVACATIAVVAALITIGEAAL